MRSEGVELGQLDGECGVGELVPRVSAVLIRAVQLRLHRLGPSIHAEIGSGTTVELHNWRG